MGRLNEVNPNEVRIFGQARDGETPQDTIDRLVPQKIPLTANILEGELEVEPGVVMQLSGGIGVSGDAEMAINLDGELVVGEVKV